MNILQLKSGKLGPITNFPPEGIKFSPFTLLIGKQGTGKSLVSQMAYFFYNLEYLLRFFEADRQDRKAEITSSIEDEILAKSLNSLRSKTRNAFAAFGSQASVIWQSDLDQPLGLRLQKVNSKVIPNPILKHKVTQFLNSKDAIRSYGTALYVPAERIVYSHIFRETDWNFLSLPRTLELFGSMMKTAGNSQQYWLKNINAHSLQQQIHRIGQSALGGDVYLRGDLWKWRVAPKIQMDLDIVSSGQKANGWVYLLAEFLTYLVQKGEMGTINQKINMGNILDTETDDELKLKYVLDKPFVLYVEEPEIHLHPEAQVSLMKILCLLVNKGIHVVVSTHSLSLLYALNNLMLKKQSPSVLEYLDPNDVTAYHFDIKQNDVSIQCIMDRDSGFISEVELGSVDSELGTAFYNSMEIDEE